MKSTWPLSRALVLLALGCSGRSTANLSTHSPDEGRDTDARSGESRADAAVGIPKHDASATSWGSNSQDADVSVTHALSSSQPMVSLSDAGVPSDASVEPRVVDGRQVLARGDRLRFETVSSDGQWIAFTEYAGTRPGSADCEPRLWECHTNVDLKVVASTGGEPATVAAGLNLAFARFVGNTLFIVRGHKRVPEALSSLLETAPELLAWRPGDSETTSLGLDVDPGAFRSSKDAGWVSVEINDVTQDLIPAAELVLIDTATLEVRSVTVKDRVRGRFTRDSRWLFFGGAEDKLSRNWPVERLSLVDGTVETVNQSVTDAWWKLSHDGQWLVHREEQILVRTPATGGTSQRISDTLLAAGGKQFDVGQDGSSVSFIRWDTGVRELYSVPLLGGSLTRLFAGDFETLLAHYESIVVYSEYAGVDQALLRAVSVTGGEAQTLGSYSTGDIESYVLDDNDDSLIVRDTTGTLRLLRTITKPAMALSQSGRAARFLPDGRVLYLEDSITPSEPPLEVRGEVDGRIFSLLGEGNLTLHDDGSETIVEERVAGPFELDPQRGRWYVTTVHQSDATSLVVDLVP